MQEGFNSKINKELPQLHPSPGLLLCYIKSELDMATYKMVESEVGKPRPVQRSKYKELARRRLNLKKIYQQGKDLDQHLTGMGHTLSVATLVPGNKIKESATQVRKPTDDNELA